MKHSQNNLGLCMMCLEIKSLTRHHIYPQRYFSTDREQPICYLCRECHSTLEYVINKREHNQKLSKKKYLDIIISFLD